MVDEIENRNRTEPFPVKSLPDMTVVTVESVIILLPLMFSNLFSMILMFEKAEVIIAIIE